MNNNESLFALQPSRIDTTGVGCFTLSLLKPHIQLVVSKPSANRHLKQNEIPDYYLKYCPLLENGLFLAPADFTAMSVFWYINHSKDPNIHTKGWKLSTKRTIQPNEELTMYYPDLLTHPKNKLWVTPEHV